MILLEESKDFYKKKSKTVKIITIVSSLFLVLLFFTGAIFFNDFIKDSDSNTIAAMSLSRVSSVEYNFVAAKEAFSKSQNKLSETAVLVTFYRLLDVYRSDSTRIWNKYVKDVIPVFPKYNTDICKAKFSNDGKLIYGFLADKTAKIWSIYGKEILSIDTFSSPIICMELSPNKNFLAIVCKDSSAYIYNIKGAKLFDFKISYNTRNTNDILKFFNDSKHLIALNRHYNALIYDISGSIKQSLKIKQQDVSCLALSQNNQFIAAAYSDHSMTVWYYNRVKSEYSLYKQFKCHKDTIWSVKFSKNNKYVLTSSADSSAAIWNLNGDKVAEADDYIFNGRRFPVPGENMIPNKGSRFSPICYAEFSPNESVIILNRYNVPEPFKLKKYEETWFKNYHSILKPKSGTVKTASSALWIAEIEDYLFYSSLNQNTFYDLKFSNELKYSAIIINNKNLTQLLYLDGNFKILELKGNQPEFSPDDQFLLTIDINQINLNLISVSKIMSLENLK